MNILYLAHRIPYPPDKGDKIRSFHQIEHLARRHSVWCACFVDSPDDFDYVPALRSICRDVIAIPLRRGLSMLRGGMGVVRGRTLTESIYDDNNMRKALAQLGSTVHFDSVVAFSSGMASHALDVQTNRRVLDLCDLDSRKWLDYAGASYGPLRALYRTEGTRLARLEEQWATLFHATILISETEAAPLVQRVGPTRVHIVGNGVKVRTVLCHGANQHPTIGFVGMMNYRPNVDAVCWFARHCWSEIRSVFPAAEFRIIGRSPTRKVRSLHAIPGVNVVGAVDDTSTELQHMDVSVAPMRIARGLQNKVLEAMAASVPVVLTSAAADGIAGRHQRDFVIADSPTAINRSVLELLRDKSRRLRMGDAARQFVARHHRWEDALRDFELIVTGSVERSRHSNSALPSGSHADHLVSQHVNTDQTIVDR